MNASVFENTHHHGTKFNDPLMFPAKLENDLTLLPGFRLENEKSKYYNLSCYSI